MGVVLQSRFTQDASSDPQRHTMFNLLRWEFNKVLKLEGFFRDSGFDQNTVRESAKRKISWRERGCLSYPGNGIRQNLSTGCGMFLPLCCTFGKSYVWAANANHPGTCWVLSPFKQSALFVRLFFVYGKKRGIRESDMEKKIAGCGIFFKKKSVRVGSGPPPPGRPWLE